MKKFFTVFSQYLAGYLMQKGFVLMAMGENFDGSGKKVFHFCNSEMLHTAIAEYKADHSD